jgi:hypothetical protein
MRGAGCARGADCCTRGAGAGRADGADRCGPGPAEWPPPLPLPSCFCARTGEEAASIPARIAAIAVSTLHIIANSLDVLPRVPARFTANVGKRRQFRASGPQLSVCGNGKGRQASKGGLHSSSRREHAHPHGILIPVAGRRTRSASVLQSAAEKAVHQWQQVPKVWSATRVWISSAA